MDNNKIIDKIKKLFALSKGDNSNEAALSLKKARALMDKHGITATQLAINEVGEMAAKGGKYKTPPDYIVLLADTCAKLFQCAVFWQTDHLGGYSYKTKPVFVGKSPAEEICAYTYNVLEAKLVKARKEYQPYVVIRLSRSTLRKKRDAYACGWAVAVADKVKTMVPPMPNMTITGAGLIPVNPLDSYIQSKVKGEPIKPRSSDLNRTDARTGFIDGKRVEINKAMNTNSFAKLLN